MSAAASTTRDKSTSLMALVVELMEVAENSILKLVELILLRLAGFTVNPLEIYELPELLNFALVKVEPLNFIDFFPVKFLNTMVGMPGDFVARLRIVLDVSLRINE